LRQHPQSGFSFSESRDAKAFTRGSDIVFPEASNKTTDLDTARRPPEEEQAAGQPPMGSAETEPKMAEKSARASKTPANASPPGQTMTGHIDEGSAADVSLRSKSRPAKQGAPIGAGSRAPNGSDFDQVGGGSTSKSGTLPRKAPIANNARAVQPSSTTAPRTSQTPAQSPRAAKDGAATSPEFQAFLQQVQIVRKDLIQTSTDRKKRITDGANAEKQKIEPLVEAEAVRLEGIYDNALKIVSSSLANARTEVEANKSAKVESTRAEAEKELDHLDALDLAKKEAMERLATDKADSATAMGEREAQRAIDGSRARADRAQEIKREKIVQLRDVKDGDRLAADVERKVADLVQEFTKGGDELAKMARRRAAEAADHIKAEATEIIAKLDEPATSAREEIIKCRDETIKSIEDQAQTALTNLQKEADSITSSLQSERQAKCAEVRSNADAISQSVDESVIQAHLKVDSETTRAGEEVTRFVNEITEVGWAGPQIVSAASDLTKAVDEHNTEQDGFATNVVTGVTTGIANALSSLREAVTKQGELVTSLAADCEAKTSEAAAKVVEKMEEARKDGAEKIADPAMKVEEKLERAVERAGEEWDRQLKVVENDISHDINDGLRKQDAAVAALISSLDEIGVRARSFVSSIVEAVVDFASFLGGVVVGMLEHVWDLLKDLWELVKKPLFWIVVAILAVVAIVVIVFFGWEVLVAALAAIGKFLLVVGVIIGVLVAAYYIYLAATKPNLSPYERGKLVGKAIDEIILAFLGTGVWSKLGAWVARVSRIAAFLDKVGDVIKAARLLRRVRDIEVAIRLIDEIKDATTVLRLLDEIKDAELVLKLWHSIGDAEIILKLWAEIGDAEKIIKLWEEIKDAETILKLWRGIKDTEAILKLWKEIKDVDTILKLWSEIKDAEKIIKLWTAINDADAILKLWAKVKDADLIVKLWGKLADSDKLVELLDKVKDGELLFRLLTKVPDVAQLERLLKLVDDGPQLERFLSQIEDPAKLEKYLTEIGTDPKKGFNPLEASAGRRLDEKIGRRLSRDPTGDFDWIDSAGKTYDAVGPVPAGRFDAVSFNRAIDKHMVKQGLDIVVVDMTGLSPAEQALVRGHIASLSRILTLP
jgi:hypothetical protein